MWCGTVCDIAPVDEALIFLTLRINYFAVVDINNVHVSSTLRNPERTHHFPARVTVPYMESREMNIGRPVPIESSRSFDEYIKK